MRTTYEGAAKDLLHIYKFERAPVGTFPIARAMCEVLPYLPAHTLVIPVPTATSRIRERGYDHAALLARGIAKERGWMWDRAVTRLSQSRQVGANRQQRHAQLKDAFAVSKPALINGADVLVVDDVVTTGSTLEAVARALKQAGAKSINAVVFAQKQ